MKMAFTKKKNIVLFLMTAVLTWGIIAVYPQTAQAKSNRIAVLYFTGTGTTEKVAKKISKAAKGTLVKIEASEPYTEDDLDWTDKSSRVTTEHRSAASPALSRIRPGIANLSAVRKVVKKADVVYLGYPIWWGEAPHIMYTLVEKVSLKGKTVIPFCTSMSSGIGNSAKNLKKNALINKKTKWLSGRSDYEGELPSQKRINAWVKKMKKKY